MSANGDAAPDSRPKTPDESQGMFSCFGGGSWAAPARPDGRAFDLAEVANAAIPDPVLPPGLVGLRNIGERPSDYDGTKDLACCLGHASAGTFAERPRCFQLQNVQGASRCGLS